MVFSTRVQPSGKRRIFNRLRRWQQSSRALLAQECGLTRPAVSAIIDEMVRDGLVRETGCGVSTGGKPPRLLELVGHYPGLPFVLLNYQYPEFEKIAPANLRGVFNDEFSGGYTAASELFALGAKEIGVIQYGVGDSNYRLRLQGFLQAHVDHGFVFKETNLCNIDSVLPPMERGYNGMGVLLSRNPRLDAVFCINDILAVGAVRFLKLSPAHHDLLIIGYDNHLPELHIANHFPTIAVNTAAMSSAAVRMLLTPELYHCKQLFISPRLVR